MSKSGSRRESVSDVDGLQYRSTGTLSGGGNTLSGWLVRYGDVGIDPATGRPERFAPGAFGDSAPAAFDLNLEHRHAAVVSSTEDGLTLEYHDKGIWLEAPIRLGPPGLQVRNKMAKGNPLGLSVEFIERRREDDWVQAGLLYGAAVTGSPAHPTTLQLRQRSGRTLTATWPSGQRLRCDCIGRSPDCQYIRIPPPVMDEMIQRALTREVVAGFASFSRPLGALGSGTLRLRRRDDGDAEVEIDLPDDEIGRQVTAAIDSAPTAVVIRPYIDNALSVMEEVNAGDGLLEGIYSEARLRGVMVSITDATEGWPAPVLAATPAAVLNESTPDLQERSYGTLNRRRRKVWL